MQKNRKLKKKIFKEKLKNTKFFSDKIKRGSVVYFSGDLGIWDIWDMAEKIPKV